MYKTTWVIQFIIINIVSLQLAFGEALQNRPETIVHELSINKLLSQIEDYKFQIHGKELPAKCEEEKKNEEKLSFSNVGTILVDYEDYLQLEKEFIYSPYTSKEENQTTNDSNSGNMIQYSTNSLETYNNELSNLKVNACDEVMHLYGKDREGSKEKTKCKPKRLKGIVDQISAFTIDVEAEDAEIEEFAKLDKSVNYMLIKAKKIKSHVDGFLLDNDIEESIKRDILAKYLGQVVLVSRDLIIISKGFYTTNESKNDQKLLNLIPVFPSALFPDSNKNEQSKLLEKITIGLHPSIERNHLKYEKLDGAMSTVSFDSKTIIQRDMISLMKAPTTKNYAIAAKWMTLHMMASQIFIYKAMIGDNTDVTLPPQCQNHFNGNLPKKMKFEFQDGAGEGFLESIIQKQGLVLSEKDTHYIDYYINNVEKNPLEDNYNGLAPFEELKSAEQALSLKDSKRSKNTLSTEPMLDDFSHSEKVLSYKMGEIKSIFKKDDYDIKGLDFIEKLITKPNPDALYEFKIASGQSEAFVLVPKRQNLSVYLAERMQREGVTHYSKLISKKVSDELYSNTVKVNFPRLYGSNVWRSWALNQLRDVIGRYKKASKNSKIYKAVSSACLERKFREKKSFGLLQSHEAYLGRNLSVCGGEDGKDLLGNVHSFISNIASDGKYSTIKQLQENELEGDWHILSSIWSSLRDRTDLFDEVAVMNEYGFLKKQMEAKNSWAMTRLSYLLAMDELETQHKNSSSKKSTRASRRKTKKNDSCINNNYNIKIGSLKKVGRILKVDQQINVGHANNILSDSQKRLVWEQIRSKYNDNTSHLITETFNNKKTYKILEDVSYKTLLTKKDVKDYTQLKGMDYLNPEKLQDDVDEYFSTSQGRLAKKLHKLYTMKGDMKSQIDEYEKLANIYGLNSEYKSKAVFLSMDSSIKKPIYKQVFQKAALIRKIKLESELESFCGLNPTDHEKMEVVFHETTANHLKLNQLVGLSNKQLDKITDKLESFSPEDWTNLFLGFGAAMLAIASIGIGIFCTAATGGFCAPLGAAMVVSGSTALGMQLLLLKREFAAKGRADEYEKHVKKIEELGFALNGSSDKVSKTWVWTIIEGISILPLIGAVAKATQVGTRIAIASTHAMLKETGKIGFKSARLVAGKQAKGAMLENEVMLSEFVAGQRSLWGSLKEVAPSIKKTWKDIKRIKELHSTGRISTRKMYAMIAVRAGGIKDLIRYSSESGEYITKAIVKKTVKENDEDIAKTFVKYWGPDLNRYYDHIRGFWGKWSISKKWQGNRLKYAEHVMEKVKNSSYPRGTNWYMKLRYKTLNEMAPSLRRIRGALKTFKRTGKVTVQTANGSKVITNAADFALHFMDDISKIHLKSGMKLKDIPYMFALQGGPHTGGVFGKRVPTILGGSMGDGFIMKKLFMARSRLNYETIIAAQKVKLGLPKYVGTTSVFRAYNAFTKVVDEAADKSTLKEGNEMLRQLEDLNYKIADAIVNSSKKNKVEKKLVRLIFGSKKEFGSHEQALKAYPTIFKKVDAKLVGMSKSQLTDLIDLDAKTIKNLLFNPKTESEKALGDILLSTVHTDELFDLKKIEGLAYEAAKKLKNYKSADQFDRYLTTLKMIVLNRDLANIQVF